MTGTTPPTPLSPTKTRTPPELREEDRLNAYNEGFADGRREVEALEAKLADVLWMSTCTKCGLRAVPTTYPVGGGSEPLRLVYRCPSEECGYAVSQPMAATFAEKDQEIEKQRANIIDMDVSLQHHDAETAEADERIAALESKLRTVERERDLAIAHDRQPYPTAAAYEAACEALNATKSKLREAEERNVQLRAALYGTTAANQMVDALRPLDVRDLTNEPPRPFTAALQDAKGK